MEIPTSEKNMLQTVLQAGFGIGSGGSEGVGDCN